MTSRIRVLDGVRGLAILMVLLAHGGRVWGWWPGLDHFLRQHVRGGWWLSDLWTPFALNVNVLLDLGSWGVDLFFVLSGFLISGILMDSREDDHYFRSFYVRRVLRIFPIYYVTLIILVFAVAPFSTEFAKLRENQWWFWSYASNWLIAVRNAQVTPVDHFWSLAIEEQFYLIWPLIIFCVHPKNLVAVCLGFIGLAFCTRTFLSFSDGSWIRIYYPTLCRIDNLAIGAAIAALVRSDAGRAWLRKWSGPTCLAGGISILAILFFYGSCSPELRVVQIFGYSLLAVFFGGMIAFVVVRSPDGRLAHLFEWRFLRFLGQISYGLYVYHALWRYVFPTAFWQSLVAYVPIPEWVAYYGGTLAVSLLSWHLFEKRVLSLKDWVAPYKASKAPTVKAAPAPGA